VQPNSTETIRAVSSHSDVPPTEAARGHRTLRKIGYRTMAAVTNLTLYAFCASYLFPFVWMLYNTFKPNAVFTRSIFSLPSPPTLDNWKGILGGSTVWTALINSTYITALSMMIIVLLSFIVAYFLSRYSFRGRNFLYGFFLIGLLVPIHALLVPLYIQFIKLHLVNRRYTLLFPYVAFHLPTAIYLYDSYIRTIPRSIEEAAFVDGATMNQIMSMIMFPMCVPITGTILILNFLGLWNEFPFALVLVSGASYRTIPIWLSTFQGQYVSDITGRLTAMFIACVPIIVAYLFLRERMMQGLTAGAIKG